MFRVFRLALFVAASVLVARSNSASAAKMYWSDRVADTITRANLDGTQQEILVSNLGEPRGIEIDVVGNVLYWADNGTNKLQKSDLNGQGIVDLVTIDLNFPAGIAADPYGGKLYWADRSNKKIQRSDLDGDNVEDLVTGLSSPYYVALDLVDDHIYWTDFGTDKIQRANLDGTDVTDLVTTGLETTRGIALDLGARKMYWADRGTDKIQRANLDGTQIEDLVQIVPPPGVDSAVHGVALDIANNHLYWVDNGTVKVQRSNLDGTDVVDILTAENSQMRKPWQIVLDLPLQAGDANQNLSYDQMDIVQVAQAGKYLTGQSATWGEGDWDAAPGGGVGNPPAGDGFFDQTDVVRALENGLYLRGPYAAIRAEGESSDRTTTVGYDALRGEVWVAPPRGHELTSINLSSKAGVFTGEAAKNLGGAFDNHSDNNVFKATFGGSFSTLSFGNVAAAGLSQQFVMEDLTVIGSLARGGGLGDVDIVYVPEPTALTLAGLISFVSLLRINYWGHQLGHEKG